MRRKRAALSRPCQPRLEALEDRSIASFGTGGIVLTDYRKISDGKRREQRLSDYLVLLSICQTYKYRGVSFFRFLLSEEKDVEDFCRRGRKKKRPPRLEVYPKCCYRSHRKKTDRESG